MEITQAQARNRQIERERCITSTARLAMALSPELAEALLGMYEDDHGITRNEIEAKIKKLNQRAAVIDRLKIEKGL